MWPDHEQPGGNVVHRHKRGDQKYKQEPTHSSVPKPGINELVDRKTANKLIHRHSLLLTQCPSPCRAKCTHWPTVEAIRDKPRATTQQTLVRRLGLRRDRISSRI